MKYLPAPKSSRWLLWFACYGLLLTLLLWANRFIAWKEPFESLIALRFMLLSFGLAAVVNAFGWLGARWVWLLASAGLAAGIAVMLVYAYRDMDGWGDLIGFLSFLLITGAGFVLGLLAEGIRIVMLKRRKQG
jgi:hypothetical protein